MSGKGGPMERTHDSEQSRPMRAQRCQRSVAGVLCAAIALLILCAFGFLPNPMSAYAADAHESVEDDRVPSIFPYLGYDWPPAAAKYPIPTGQDLEHPSTHVAEKKVEDINANNYLRLEARAHNGDDSPACAAEVRFEWTSEGKTETFLAQTNGKGTAAMTQWLDSDCRGTPMLVVISVKTDDWANTDYAWFVPE
jgi:hypothetical protein